ncbi:MAG: PaaX family transcriptional regulator [Marmoricola sp.]
MRGAPEAAATGSPRSRTVLVTYLGAVVRARGGWMPIAGTIELMASLGVDAPSVRTAVHRLKGSGWLAPEVRAGVRGYALTDHARATLASGDEVIWHARRPADLSEGWCILHVSVPETIRSKRYRLRSHLASLGFGNVGTAMWIAPARMRAAAARAVAELELEQHVAVFVGAYHGPQDLTELLYASWDLAAIDAAYRAFVEEHASLAARVRTRAPEPADAFVSYLRVVDHWRKLPFRDPGLPSEVLSPGWSGPEATQLFEELVRALEGPALAHAAASWPALEH